MNKYDSGDTIDILEDEEQKRYTEAIESTDLVDLMSNSRRSNF